MLLDMNEIQKMIVHGISVGVSFKEIYLETIEKFGIPFDLDNKFLRNTIRQIILYHEGAKLNLELTRLDSQKEIEFQKIGKAN